MEKIIMCKECLKYSDIIKNEIEINNKECNHYILKYLIGNKIKW